MSAHILLVDDEKNIRRSLRMILEGSGYRISEAESAEEAEQLFADDEFDLAILDVRLPGRSGLELLQILREQKATKDLPIIVISGHATLAEAVQSIQRGATDFLEKPLDRDRVLVTVRNNLEAWSLRNELASLRRESVSRYQMVGDSPKMRELYNQIEKVAPTSGRVLITGESGSGKELIARAVHDLSLRSKAAFVKVNCAAIPAELIESELFGHERGAFTGATSRKRGLFEVASGGTLFLDEIGDMGRAAQAKVLRALQSGEIARVGSEQTLSVDVRVIAATNRDLQRDVEAGEFREDLYFRLNVIELHSPPLRERRADIPALAKLFLSQFCKENGIKEKFIEEEALAALSSREWRGNVRELRNVIERAAILSGSRIQVEDISVGSAAPPSTSTLSPTSLALPTVTAHGSPLTLKDFRDHAEKSYLLRVLGDLQWNISRAAIALGVERTNLHKKLRALGIDRATNAD